MDQYAAGGTWSRSMQAFAEGWRDGQDRGDGCRWRVPRFLVEIHLAEGSEAHAQLKRILGQFEQFCIVTQSVREGMNVEVTIKDAHGRVLLGDESLETGA